jgi:hypothetical protein
MYEVANTTDPSLHSHSTSNVAEEYNDLVAVPSILRYLPRPLRYENFEPIEASGLAVDAYARGTVIMSSMFLGPALLKLASEAAGCKSQLECEDAKVYGFRPS